MVVAPRAVANTIIIEIEYDADKLAVSCSLS